MGVVYLARVEGAVGFVKPVVIKVLLPEHSSDEHVVRLFAREARILSQLRHPSLVDVIEFGEQDGGYILVLEYVRGHHIGLWLRYLALKNRPVPFQVVLLLIIDVLEALHHAHTQLHPDGSPMHIVHRDVSPSNILLDESGRARLLDFGVARMRGGTHDYRTKVQGGFMGKLPYTAPEVFAGCEASPQSDLYACAVVLHEALSGHNPFRAETQAATLQKVLHHVPQPVAPHIPGAPDAIDQVLARALAKNPEGRHGSARELALDLRALLTSPESDLRAKLAEMLKSDFGDDMARLLKVESLAERDAAWRRSNALVAPAHAAGRRKTLQLQFVAAPPLAPPPSVSHQPPPAPIGATVAATRPRSSSRSGARRATPSELIAPPAASSGPPPRPSEHTRDTLPAPELSESDAAELSGQSVIDDADEIETTLKNTRAMSRSMPLPLTAAGQRRLWLLERGWTVLGLLAIVLCAVVLGRQTALMMRGSLATAPTVTSRATAPGAAAAASPAATAATPSAGSAQSATEAPALQTAALTPNNAPDAARGDGGGKPAAHASSANKAVAPSDRSHTKRSADPDPGALTRALRKQQPKLEACFKEHSTGLEGAPTTKLEFDLAQDGTLTRVDLSPRTLSGTLLGQCLLRVARSTPFPAQPRAVSFVIPLTANTTRGG